MRRQTLRIILALWIIGILIPMAFMGKTLPTFGRLFDLIFNREWMHLLMHAFLYAVLGLLLSLLMKTTAIKAALFSLGCCLVVGVVHESLQLATARSWPGFSAEILDLGVDLLGSFVGISVGILKRKQMVLKDENQDSSHSSI